VRLAQHHRVRVRHVRRRVDDRERGALPHELAVDVRPQRLGQLPRGEDRVDHPEVVEHLERAGLQAVAAGARERRVGPVDDADGDAAAGEVDRQGQPGRPRTCDED
jgi:hypothetical protein